MKKISIILCLVFLALVSYADIRKCSLAASSIMKIAEKENSHPVEYIESTVYGYQYIDLELISNIDKFCDFEIRYRMTWYSAGPSMYGWELPFGYRYGATARYGLWAGTSLNYQDFYCGINSQTSIMFPRDTNWHHVKVKNGISIELDSVTYPISSGTVRNNIRALLFLTTTNSDGSSIQGYCPCQISMFKLWNANGELLRDLIPYRIRNENGDIEGVMYDLITNEFLKNSGQNSFIIGPDL